MHSSHFIFYDTQRIKIRISCAMYWITVMWGQKRLRLQISTLHSRSYHEWCFLILYSFLYYCLMDSFPGAGWLSTTFIAREIIEGMKIDPIPCMCPLRRFLARLRQEAVLKLDLNRMCFTVEEKVDVTNKFNQELFPVRYYQVNLKNREWNSSTNQARRQGIAV